MPIPAFYSKSDDSEVISDALIERCEALSNKDADFWFSMGKEEILEGTGVDADAVDKGSDVMDVWVDSGLSWNTLVSSNSQNELTLCSTVIIRVLYLRILMSLASVGPTCTWRGRTSSPGGSTPPC